MNRPQTTLVLAMTADGKITDLAYSPARFGSPSDKLHLEKQVSLVDAVLFGAGTLRSYGTTLPVNKLEFLQARQQRGQLPQPLQIVCSASGQLSPKLRFFSQPVPRWLLTTPKGANLWQENKMFERILVSKSDRFSSRLSEGESIDWLSVLAQFKQLGIEKLAILGGGKLVASLLEVNALDEFYLTICPFILGGENTPTPVAGKGWLQERGLKLELISVKQIDREVFLHYQIKN